MEYNKKRQKADLYSILVNYAAKGNPVLVEEELFLAFLETHAGKVTGGVRIAEGGAERFRAGLDALIDEGKCEVVYDELGKGSLYLSKLCHEMIWQKYGDTREERNKPFPSEDNLGITIPPSRLRHLMTTAELAACFEFAYGPNASPHAKHQEGLEDDRILMIHFPEGFGSALVMPDMIPQKIIEAAFYKLQSYMQNNTNKEYLYRKLLPQFNRKESFLGNEMDLLQHHPYECYANLMGGEELTYVFWAAFCNMIKLDIKERNSRVSDLMGVIQGACIVEAANYCYKSIASKKMQKEQALRELEEHIKRPPYLFTFEEIIKYTNPDGRPILNLYTKEELETWLRKKVTDSPDHKSPEFLILYGNERGQLFVHKQELFPVCLRIIGDTTDALKAAVADRWSKVLRSYRKELSMEDDKTFDRLLRRKLAKINPFLLSLLNDSRLQLINSEMNWSKTSASDAARLFGKAGLNPCSVIFNLKRKRLLDEVKAGLPLRFTLPLIAAICGFFKRLFKKESLIEDDMGVEADHAGTARSSEVQIRALAHLLVPEGKTLDSYLDELKNGWVQLTNRESRETIVSDVNTIVRNKVRELRRERKGRPLSHEELTEVADNLVTWDAALRKVNGKKEVLKKYIELYILKLLQGGGTVRGGGAGE
ncbi:MAG: hypothetical protein LBR16_08285 [Treponema sp.]|jgi:hypothetical protein|nr:hypothetical protein [Treponema sp.]